MKELCEYHICKDTLYLILALDMFFIKNGKWQSAGKQSVILLWVKNIVGHRTSELNFLLLNVAIFP